MPIRAGRDTLRQLAIGDIRSVQENSTEASAFGYAGEALVFVLNGGCNVVHALLAHSCGPPEIRSCLQTLSDIFSYPVIEYLLHQLW